MAALTYTIRVTDDGRVIWPGDLIRHDCQKYRGKDLVMKIAPMGAARSRPQNQYYWGVVLKGISDHTGHTPEFLHDWMKLKFLAVQDLAIAGEVYPVGRSTTDLSTSEFEHYLSNIRMWASETLGIYIKLPNEGEEEL